MKTVGLATSLLTLVAALCLAPGCCFPHKHLPSPGICKQGSIDFENPSPGGTFVVGATYPAGATIYSYQGLFAASASLVYPNGSSIFGQATIVTNPPFAFGNGQMIQLSSALINFDLRPGTFKAVFEYLDRGGTINLATAGGPGVYIGNMAAMPTTFTINGVKVTKSMVTLFYNPAGTKIAEKGTITLTSGHDIGGMRIGGSEMHLDNFCFN